MKSNLPLFTVIIPQKDRAEFLRSTIETCIGQSYENMEILVSDDGSIDNSLEVVNEFIEIDSRVQLFHQKEPLGMRENFEFLLKRVKPGYVIALGGDDGLMPNAIERMYEILSSTNCELLTWEPAKFIFPGLYSDNGLLVVPRKAREICLVKSRDFLKRTAKNLNYNGDPQCPMFYIKGVVSTNLIDRVRGRTTDGRFYSCATPDGYSGIVLAGEVEEYAFTTEPLSIVGSNHSSQGVSYMRSDKNSRERAKSFFSQNNSIPMHDDLARQPYSPLITLMSADYLLTARDLPGWPGSFPPLDMKNVLFKSMQELCDGRWSHKNGGELIKRELAILEEIALKYDIYEYFKYLKYNMKIKKYPLQDMLIGTGITSRTIVIGSKILGIKTIAEAALIAKVVNNAFPYLTVMGFLKVIKRMICILYRSKIRREKLV